MLATILRVLVVFTLRLTLWIITLVVTAITMFLTYILVEIMMKKYNEWKDRRAS